jgi:hypothetical protein
LCRRSTLQHQGHSRTIIGYEVKRDGSVNLLILDPSTQGLFEGVRTGDLRQLRRGEVDNEQDAVRDCVFACNATISEHNCGPPQRQNVD